MAKVSVIIPFYNASATLERCLTAVCSQQSVEFEVLCVDDRSTDDSAAIAERFNVRLVQMIHRSGAATARNLAASMAEGEIFFFLDADVYAPPGLLAQAAAILQNEPDLDALFGAYTIFPDANNFASIYKNLVHHYTHLTSQRQAHTFWCGCGAIRRNTFFNVNGFDESYAAASVEDIDLGYRLTNAGANIRLVPELRVIHAKRYSLFSLIRSDLLDRAIPWTKLMARENIFLADLNLKFSNILSGFLLALFIPLGATALTFIPLDNSLPAFLALLILYFALNAKIWWYVYRVKGFFFSLLFIVMYSITYLYSVLGFAVGLWLYLWEKRK